MVVIHLFYLKNAGYLTPTRTRDFVHISDNHEDIPVKSSTELL